MKLTHEVKTDILDRLQVARTWVTGPRMQPYDELIEIVSKLDTVEDVPEVVPPAKTAARPTVN